MKKIFTAFLFCCFSVSLFAQSWENPFSDVYQLDSLNVWIVGDNGTIINTKDGGNSWDDYSIDTSLCLRSVCFNTLQTGYVTGGDNLIVKTTNGGEKWDSLELYSIQSNYSVFFLNENYGWISAGYNGLYKTIDGGQSWSHQADTIGKIIFFDTLNGYGKTYKNLWIKIARTWDGGLTWNEVCSIGNSALGGGDFHFVDISFGVKVTSAVTNVYYSKTSDGGQTWAEIDNIPGGVPHVEFLNFQNAWFGYSCLINYSGDFFETYNTFQLPYDNDIYNISVKGYSNGWAVGGDYGWDNGCIWKLVGVNEWIEILPAGLNENSQNLVQLNTFPNPFTKTMKLEFELKNKCEVKISIHNNLGQEFQTLLTERKAQGSHQFTWSSTNLDTGIYFIKLQTDKEITTRKVIKY